MTQILLSSLPLRAHMYSNWSSTSPAFRNLWLRPFPVQWCCCFVLLCLQIPLDTKSSPSISSQFCHLGKLRVAPAYCNASLLKPLTFVPVHIMELWVTNFAEYWKFSVPPCLVLPAVGGQQKVQKLDLLGTGSEAIENLFSATISDPGLASNIMM